jgi:hypothetical protein
VSKGDISDPSPTDGFQVYVQERKAQGKVLAEQFFRQNKNHARNCFNKLIANVEYRKEFLKRHKKKE